MCRYLLVQVDKLTVRSYKLIIFEQRIELIYLITTYILRLLHKIKFNCIKFLYKYCCISTEDRVPAGYHYDDYIDEC